MLRAVKLRRIVKYGDCKRRGDDTVSAAMERETEGKGSWGRCRMEREDNTKTWEVGMRQANRNARERRGPLRARTNSTMTASTITMTIRHQRWF